MTMEEITPQEKARERARLLLAWADGKTLQSLNIFRNKIKWIDYAEEQPPVFIDIVKWRIKPEPRIKWEIRGASAGGMKWSSSTFSEEKAAEWKAKGWIVTEWMEVLK